MGRFLIEQQTEPSSPSTGFVAVYVDQADGLLKAKKSNGDVVIIDDQTALALHEAASDPHTQYLKESDAATTYEPLGVNVLTVKYVSQLYGNDTTGTGDESKPYATIKKALSMITDSSSTKPYSVRVMPGIYTEDNSAGPITIPARVALVAEDKLAAILKFNTAANIGFSFGFHTIVDGFNVAGPTSAAAFQAVSKTKWGMYNINFSSGSKLITVNGGSNDIFIENIFCGTSTTGVFELIGGAFVRMKNIECEGSGTAFSISGTGTRLNLENCRVSGATEAFHLGNTSILDFTGLTITNATTGIHVHDSATLQGQNLDANESVTNQLSQIDSTAIIKVSHATLNQDNISIVNWNNVRLVYEDAKTGQTTIANGMVIGTPESGRDAQFGQGGEYTRGMKVYTYNGSNYTDKTADLLAEGGNTVSLPNTSANTAIYIGSALIGSDSNPVKFWGLGVYQTVAAVLGAGSLVWEYWNGSAWTEFYHMGYEEDTYKPLARTGITTMTEEYYVNFSDKLFLNWIANDPVTLGTNYHWIRIRIATGITTSFTWDALELLASHTSSSGDGFTTFHGPARPIRKLDLAYGSFQAAVDSPADQDIYLGDFLDVGRIENLFSNGVTDRTGNCFQLPLDIDTSCPIRLRITYRNSTNTGSTNWKVRYAVSNDGDPIYVSTAAAPTAATGEQTITRSTTVPATAGNQTSEIFELNIPDAVAERASAASGGLIWVTLERDGGADTNGGDVTLLDFIPYYTAWRNGGHIANWI